LKLLLVDDDPDVREYVGEKLASFGIDTALAKSSVEAREFLDGNAGRAFDLILLDVGMPDESGWDFLSRLRQDGDETPVIFLSAHQSVEERVKGLQLGADDYVGKPFDATELEARIQAVLRRRRSFPTLQGGGLWIDLARRSVELHGERVEVSPREFELLVALVEAAGEVLSRSELLRKVWAMEFDPGTNILEVQIARLRRKLESAGPRIIETVVGRGYRFNA